ncbi:MAG: phage portal protein, partial [Oscillospiraceae bacterium]
LNDGYYVADSFSDDRDSCGFAEANYYDIEKSGNFISKTFKESEVLHYTFDNSKIRPILENALMEYSELLSVAGKKYRRSAFQKGIVNIEASPGGTKEKQKEQDEMLKTNMQEFFNADSSVLPLRKGYTYDEIGKYNNIDSSTDISILTKEIFSRVAEALNIPVAIMMSDVLETKEVKKDYINGCINTIIKQIETENTRKLSKKDGVIKHGIKFKIELPPELSDFFYDAGNIDKYIYSGICSINEIRAKKGLPKLTNWWADSHFITKNYALAEDIKKAGEKNE